MYAINYEKIRDVFSWLFFYVSNLYQAKNTCYLEGVGHLWSLAIEEQFYLFWPILLFLIPNRHVLSGILATIIISLISKSLFFFNGAHWISTAYFTLNNLYSLGIGALGAYFMINHPGFTEYLKKYSGRLLLLVLLFYLFWLYLERYYDWKYSKEILSELIFAVFSLVLILRLYKASLRKMECWLFENPLVIYGGKISYGLYLYHQFIPDLYETYIKSWFNLNIQDKYMIFLVYLTLTIMLSSISWYIIESPILKLKEKSKYTL